MLAHETISAAAVLSTITATSAAMTYPKLMRDLRERRLQLFAVPHRDAAALQDLVSLSVFVSIGVAAIQILRSDVPVWASIFVPALTTAMIVLYTAVKLWPREKFKPRRFFDLVLSPVLAGISPSWQALLSTSGAIGVLQQC